MKLEASVIEEPLLSSYSQLIGRTGGNHMYVWKENKYRYAIMNGHTRKSWISLSYCKRLSPSILSSSLRCRISTVRRSSFCIVLYPSIGAGCRAATWALSSLTLSCSQHVSIWDQKITRNFLLVMHLWRPLAYRRPYPLWRCSRGISFGSILFASIIKELKRKRTLNLEICSLRPTQPVPSSKTCPSRV